MDDTTYEQEIQVTSLFKSIALTFKRIDKASDPQKLQAELREVAQKLQESKTLIKEFEREARSDGLSAAELAARKKQMVQQLNGYIEKKKEFTDRAAGRGALLPDGEPKRELSRTEKLEAMSTQQVMEQGKKEIKATDDALKRSERIVEDTIQIATGTASTLHGQTKQLEKVLDDLDEITFSLKKAKQVIRDITRGLATDKCIMSMMFLVVMALIALVVVKVVKGKGNKITIPKPQLTFTSTNITGRRLLGWALDAAEVAILL